MGKEKELKLERCGFCGCYFRGKDYVPENEVNEMPKEDLDKAPLGYCPNAEAEDAQQNPEQYITRDMMIDAGLELEE